MTTLTVDDAMQLSRLPDGVFTRRRKPLLTYKSPTGGEPYTPMSACSQSSRKQTSSKTGSPPSSCLNVDSTSTYRPLKRKRYPMEPPLPLYHPLGQLALSLPPLDAASFGLPTAIGLEDGERRSSRARRPAAKLREVEDVLLPVVGAAGAVRESKEKSPRKRRSGPNGKRKRKEGDDGDATYPAKRTRIPRGMANQVEEELAAGAPEVTPTPEPMAEAVEEKRRSTRNTTRRESSLQSSGSEETTVSASVPGGMGLRTAGPDPGETMESDHERGKGGIDEKEEGELSEEGQNPMMP